MNIEPYYPHSHAEQQSDKRTDRVAADVEQNKVRAPYQFCSDIAYKHCGRQQATYTDATTVVAVASDRIRSRQAACMASHGSTRPFMQAVSSSMAAG
jgi:hypothetical protein